MFTKREILHLFLSIVILGFVFGFDDGNKSFILQNWILNLIRFIIIVAIIVLFREFVLKFFAKRHNATSEYEIWNINRVWFTKKLERGIPLGILMSIFLAIGSKGKFFFTAIGSHKFEEYKTSRSGRKHPYLTYLEEMQIASMGILSSLFLAIIVLIMGNYSGFVVPNFVTVCFYMALLNMIPFSSLDGSKIFFGSILTYIFLLVFIFVAFILIEKSIILALVLGLIIALAAMFTYFYNWG